MESFHLQISLAQFKIVSWFVVPLPDPWKIPELLLHLIYSLTFHSCSEASFSFIQVELWLLVGWRLEPNLLSCNPHWRSPYREGHVVREVANDPMILKDKRYVLIASVTPELFEIFEIKLVEIVIS